MRRNRSARVHGRALVLSSALLVAASPASAATFAPTSTAELVAAMTTANANGEADTIDLDGQAFSLAAVDNSTDGPNGLPSVLAGSVLTIRNGTIERTGTPLFRLLHVASGATLALENVTLRGGAAGVSPGGAVYNAGTFAATGCTFSGNSSDEPGGAIYNSGAIPAIRNSTFSGNAAYVGAGLHNDGSVGALTNSTFALNASGYQGGGISNGQSGTIGALVSCIVATNSGGDGPPDFADGGTTSTASDNVVGIGDGSGLTDGADGNQVGSGATPLDPLLGPLADNGGPTFTHALLAGSPALDTGSNPAALASDQRGAPFARTSGAGTDVGAFEVQVEADLSVTKTDSPDPVTAGTNLAWTLTVSNAGPANAATVALSDTLPAGTTFVSLVSPGGWSCATPAVGAAGAVTCSIASLAPGSAVFTLTAAVGASVPDGTVLSNTATVTSTTSDPDSADLTATATTTVSATADLSVTKTDGVTQVDAGGSLTYTIVASNAGPVGAAGATLTDPLPASLSCTFTSVAAGGATGATANGSGSITDVLGLPVGASVTYTVSCSVSADAFGSVSNTATIAAPAGVTDPNGANDAATDVDTVRTGALLSATKTVSGTFSAGATVTYAIVLRNDGIGPQADAAGPELLDVLPATLALSGATASAGTASADAGTRTVTWNGALAAGASVTITITATVLPTAAGTVVSNQGALSWDANGDGTNDAAGSTDDPRLPGASDPTDFPVPVEAARDIPVLGPFGALLMAALVAAAGLRFRTR